MDKATFFSSLNDTFNSTKTAEKNNTNDETGFFSANIQADKPNNPTDAGKDIGNIFVEGVYDEKFNYWNLSGPNNSTNASSK